MGMSTSAFARRVAMPFATATLVATLGACTVGAPAPGGPPAEPESDPSGSATGRAGEDSVARPPTAEPPGRARWTVFVYANGDSGRSRDLATDLARMAEAKLAADTKVIVLADWNAGLTDVDGHPFASGSDWIALSGGGVQQSLGRDVEQDFDDPAVLRRAVGRAFRDNPADHHGLIVWNHSAAGDVHDGQRPGATPMSVTAMTNAIRDGLGDAGLHGERSLDFIGMDSYEPPRVETAFAMRRLAEVNIVNTASASGSSWAYADALSFLAEHEDASGATFAAFEAAAAAKHGPREHAAIASVNLDGLAIATSSLVHAVVEDSSSLPHVVSAMFATAAHAKLSGRPPSYARFVSELASSGPTMSAVTAAAEDVAAHLTQTVIGPPGGTADLAITLPGANWRAELEDGKDWRAATDWDDLVASAQSAGDLVLP